MKYKLLQKIKMIKAEIIADSTNWLGKRLTTFVLEYPRYIHAEFMTHRVFSKNSASSRAIPIQKVIKDVEEANVLPIWTHRQKGMQGKLVDDEIIIKNANKLWYEARDAATNLADDLDGLGIHKQNANRLLEPFFLMRVICTGTEWDNFFLLRDHPAAAPEIQELAKAIKKAMEESTPKFLNEGQWHIPFGDKMDLNILLGKVMYNDGFVFDPAEMLNNMLKVATARCGRISYLTFAGEIDYREDIRLYNDLVEGEPQHLSPTEHIAQVPTINEIMNGDYDSSWDYNFETKKAWLARGRFVSNLNGWKQYRKVIENGKYT